MTNTIIVLVRHEEYKGNSITESGQNRCFVLGTMLRSCGYVIDKAFSSPQWRCIQTVHGIIDGGQYGIPLSAIDPRLDDLRADERIEAKLLQRIRDSAYDKGSDIGVVFSEDTTGIYHCERRGRELASALVEYVAKYYQQTILVCSHGQTRIEPAIWALAYAKPTFLLARGEAAILTFENLRLINVAHFHGRVALGD